MKVLLDTDIGNDIDDALTLSYLLNHPDCELLGVTTVTAAPHDRAKLASAIAYGRGIPIAAGAARPLQREPLQEPPFSRPGSWPHEDTFPNSAVNLMREAILAHPDEVTIVAIGPLTNVAQLLHEHPGLPLKSIVLMGGRYFTPGDRPEWNIHNDPEAAVAVFGSSLPVRAIGLDVTRQVTMTEAAFRAHFTGILADFAEPWLQLRGGVTFHDPLAAATLFQPFCGYERGFVTVDDKGFTAFRPDLAGPHEVAVTVDGPAFLAHHLSFVA